MIPVISPRSCKSLLEMQHMLHHYLGDQSMSDWKTLDEILPEMGRAAEADPENWREQFEVDAGGRIENLRLKESDDRNRYRRKPRTMTYTVERPEPMREHPERGQRYWSADPTRQFWATVASWSADDFDLRQFNRGFVYATEEEAVVAAKAMVGGE